MLLSKELKYVFIHVPKTGGTSVSSLILSHPEIFKHSVRGYWDGWKLLGNKHEYPKVTTDLYKHASIKEVNDYLQRNGESHEDYFKFAFIRNPWDLLVSAYEYYKQYMIKGVNLSEHEQQKTQDALDRNFNDWCCMYAEGISIYQHTLIFTNGEIGVSHVAKMENMTKELKFICGRISPNIDMNKIKILHLNSTKRKPYQEYYDHKSFDVVATKFETIIKLGGYEF